MLETILKVLDIIFVGNFASPFMRFSLHCVASRSLLHLWLKMNGCHLVKRHLEKIM